MPACGALPGCLPSPTAAGCADHQLTARIVEIEPPRRRFGYRRVMTLLRTEFPAINHKWVYRLYRDQVLAVRRRKLIGVRTPLQAATQLNEVWSMDFVGDQLACCQ